MWDLFDLTSFAFDANSLIEDLECHYHEYANLMAANLLFRYKKYQY